MTYLSLFLLLSLLVCISQASKLSDIETYLRKKADEPKISEDLSFVASKLSEIEKYLREKADEANKSEDLSFVGLTIIAAAFGKADVTSVVRKAVVNNSTLQILVSNNVFADSWPGTLKTLVIFYKFGDSRVYTAIGIEGETITLEDTQFLETESFPTLPDDEVKVVSAVFGVKDVSVKTSKLLKNGNGKLVTPVEDTVFGDGMYGTVKSFVLLLQQGDKYQMTISEEHNSLNTSFSQ